MFSSNRIVFLSAFILIATGLAGLGPVQAGSEDDAIRMYTDVFEYIRETDITFRYNKWWKYPFGILFPLFLRTYAVN